MTAPDNDKIEAKKPDNRRIVISKAWGLRYSCKEEEDNEQDEHSGQDNPLQPMAQREMVGDEGLWCHHILNSHILSKSV